MKLNNKGLSITELLVSIVLVSGIMIFLYSLLYSVNEDYYKNDIAIDNQTIRFEIIKTIQKDLLENDLVDIEVINNEISFVYSQSTAVLNVYEDKITYTSKNGANNTFEFKNAVAYSDIKTSTSNIYENKYLVEISIPIKSTGSDSESYMDDITLTFETSFDPLFK